MGSGGKTPETSWNSVYGKPSKIQEYQGFFYLLKYLLKFYDLLLIIVVPILILASTIFTSSEARVSRWCS